MANTGFLNTSELDFDNYKNNLKTYLKGQSQFSDYDFDGSNINVLLDVLAYNTYLNGFYLNMVGSEMFLDTAQLRESIVSHAKELNYIPRSRTSAVAHVNFSIYPPAGAQLNYNPITIPKYYPVTSLVDNQTVTFTTASEILAYPSGFVNGAFTSSSYYEALNVPLYEGKVVSEYFNVLPNVNTRYILSSENVDTNSIEVLVRTSTAPYISLWTRASSIFGLSGTSNVFFIQGYGSNQYELIFGDGTSGTALENNWIVGVTYRDTAGDLGNGAFVFRKTTNIQSIYTNISITTVTAAADGSERESNNSISFNAPRFFTTQDRGVTSIDFENLAKAKFPQLQSVYAYGGEQLDPPQYGRIAISVKPSGTAGTISQNLKDQIVAYLSTKAITVKPIIVDPEYFYTGITSDVFYDAKLTTLGSSQIASEVRAGILEFANNNLINFGDDLRFSKLVAAIDNADTSIIGNETVLNIIYRWSPITGQTSTISFSYDNELYHETTLYQLPQGHTQVIQSTSFNYYFTQDETTYSAFLGDDGLGFLYVYTNVNNAGTITRNALGSPVGTVDYDTGAVALSANVYSYSGSYISIYAKLMNQDIYINKNKYLIIDGNDINITMNSANT
jgi:hypothetical protein